MKKLLATIVKAICKVKNCNCGHRLGSNEKCADCSEFANEFQKFGI
jgi:recombinational DNA repair protein RecR